MHGKIRTWMDDAENSLNRGGIETARAIYAYALGQFKSKKGVWMRACALEKKYGTSESLEQVRRWFYPWRDVFSSSG